MISERSFRDSHAETNQWRLFAFMTEADTSTVTLDSGTPESNCFWTSPAYQEWKHFLKWSFMGLLTETSRGCSRSVQFAGTWTDRMLCSSSSDRNSGVVCPLKQSKLQEQDENWQGSTPFVSHQEMKQQPWTSITSWSLHWTNGSHCVTHPSH